MFLGKSFLTPLFWKHNWAFALWFFPCCQVLYIQAFVLVFLLGKFMRKVFFGQLRAAEMEVHFCLCSFTSLVFSKCLLWFVIWPIFAIVQHRQHLIERSWYAVTETCLAFTVFRDDFSPRFVALFTLLLFLKCFHWLAEDRVDFVSDTLIYTDTSRAKWHIFELKCLQLSSFSNMSSDGEKSKYIMAFPLQSIV